MSCKSCEKIVSRCDSCFYADGDITYKLVTFCKDCNAYICSNCEPDKFKRAKAAANRAVENSIEYLKKIIK
jgi:hypothetical protein